MRKTALFEVEVIVGMALAITVARAQTAPPQIDPRVGGSTAPTGYSLPFDPDAVSLPAPLGPLMAFGPSSPEDRNTGLSPRQDDEEHE